MSLLRLLTAGKSLVDVRNAENRYRVVSHGLLPQFNPGRNPFLSRTTAEVSHVTGSQVGEGNLVAPAKCEVVWSETATRLGAWKVRLSRLFHRPRAQVPKPVTSPYPKVPVQGELSLDRIKVVRNDLSDADLEIVPAKTRAAPGSRAGEQAVPAKTPWERVAARILGGEKT